VNRALLLYFLAVAPLAASMPPLPLPAWIQVDLALDRPPELGGTATVRLQLAALLGKLPGTRWELILPDQLELVRGAHSGTADLEPGKPATIEAVVRAKAQLEGANLSVEVTSRPPRTALVDQVERTTRGEPERREGGLKLVSALPAQDVQRRIVGLTVSAEEGLLAEAPDPAYRRLVRSGPAVFLLLDAVPGVDTAGAVAQLKALLPRLATFRRISTGKPDDPLARIVADLTLEAAKLRYQQALLALSSGSATAARLQLAGPEVAIPGLPPSLDSARRVALAAAAALSGERAAALRELDDLAPRLPRGPASRYLDLARAEVRRRAGRPADARAAYQRALAAAPSLTLARTRLRDLP
jgi:hypothetical protein